MNKVKINSLVELEVEQIKITGKVFVGGKELSAGVNKTLDSSVIQQLPSEVVAGLTAYAFGQDYSAEQLLSIAEQLKGVAEQKQAEEELANGNSN